MAGVIKKVAGTVAATTLATGLILAYEGVRTAAYYDPVGIPTICTGHTEGVKIGHTATISECEALTQADTEIAMAAVLRLSSVPLNHNELGAYTDFVYNVGAGAFARSTLLRKLNAGDRPGACKELLRWVYAGNPKRKLRGLVKRRQAEYDLCMTPVGEPV